jgi:hypothetical protein
MSPQPRATPWVQTSNVIFALKGQKPLKINTFALSGRQVVLSIIPRALPWAMFFWPFRPLFSQKHSKFRVRHHKSELFIPISELFIPISEYNLS